MKLRYSSAKRSRAGYTLVEMVVWIVFSPVNAFLGAGLGYVGGMVFGLDPAVDFWRVYVASVVFSAGCALIPNDNARLGVCCGGLALLWLLPICRVQSEGEPVEAGVVLNEPPVKVVAPSQAPSGIEPHASSRRAQTAGGTAGRVEAIPESLRGDYHPTGVKGCPKQATLTLTSSRVLVDGCSAAGTDGLVTVENAEIDPPLYTFSVEGDEAVVLKVREDGAVVVFQPAKWKGTWTQ